MQLYALATYVYSRRPANNPILPKINEAKRLVSLYQTLNSRPA